MYWDDGDTSDLYSVDHANNTSRFRLVGSARINPDVQAGFMMEMDIRIGARSNQVTQIDDDGVSGAGGILGGAALGDGIGGAGDSVIGIRTANWWLESKHYGRLTVGRLNTSTAGIAQIDLSNAGVIITSDPGNYQGAFLMRNGLGALGSSWANQCGGPSGAGPYSSDCNEHGTSRRDAVRYDTPTYWGFTASGSFGEDDFWDVGLRYSGEHHGFRVAAGVGYRWFDDREPDVLVLGPPDDRLNDTGRRQLAHLGEHHARVDGLFVSGAYINYDFRGANANERFGGVTGVGARSPRHPPVVGRCRHPEELDRLGRHHLLRRVRPLRRRHRGASRQRRLSGTRAHWLGRLRGRLHCAGQRRDVVGCRRRAEDRCCGHGRLHRLPSVSGRCDYQRRCGQPDPGRLQRHLVHPGRRAHPVLRCLMGSDPAGLTP